MKRPHAIALLLVPLAILSASCAMIINLAASKMPNLMLASPDGTSRLVWDFRAKTMTIDDPETFEVKKVWNGASAASVKGFAFSQDSRYMVFVSEGQLKIWDFTKNIMHRTLEPTGEPWSAVFSRDNQYLAATDRDSLDFYVSVWNFQEGQLLWRYKTSIGFPQFLDFDRSSGLLAVGGFGDIEILSNPNPHLVRTIELGKSEKVDSVVFSPSSKYIAAGIKKESPEVRVWDIASGEARIKCQLLGHTNRIVGPAIIFNYNEKYLATGAADLFSKEEDPAKRSEVFIWDLDRCRKVRAIQEFTGIGASSDGRFFAWDKDLNKMRTYFWGGTWIHDITGKNMFTSVNEVVVHLTDGPGNGQPPTIAITDFMPIGTSPSAFEKFLSEEFITRISLTRRFRVVERHLLDKVLTELKFGVSDLVDPKTAAKVGKLLGAEYLLIGTLADEKYAFKINARIIDTETAEVTKAASSTVVKDPMIKALILDQAQERSVGVSQPRDGMNNGG